MLKTPIHIIALLLSVECAVLFAAAKRPKWFSFFPAVFWIYAIPMLLSTFGVIDAKCAWYKPITDWVLPASLVLLLIPTDMKAIVRLGPIALGMMLVGSLGIMFGICGVYALAKGAVGVQMWSGFGALCGSWVGGSANMIAVKEALGTPDAVFAPMLLVDTVVPYVWMGMLIAGAAWQSKYDALVRADRSVLDALRERMARSNAVHATFSFGGVLTLFAVAACGSWSARALAGFIPEVKGVFTLFTWAIVVASLLGLILSCTPARRLEECHASKIGSWLLYFVLTTIGAKARITDVSSAGLLILCGAAVVAIHAVVLFVGARIMKAPMFLVATASQANIGGVASAPVVAAVYEPELASVGLLLAILGNIMGTYAGIVAGYLCKIIGGV
jgi:uncharacterized membrane protein